jgi:hypothetical protein
MNWRKWIAYGIGVMMIAFSIYFYFKFTNHYQEAVTTMRTLKPLRPLQVGEMISNENVQSVLIPITAHDANAITDLEAIRGLRVKVPLSTGEEFAAWKLSDVLLAPDEGQRYYSFKTDALQNVSNKVRRGDHVDVWVEFDSPRRFIDRNGEKQWIGSVKLLDNLLVSDVKSAEGIEITDSNDHGAFSSLRAAMASDEKPDMNRVRASPNAKPEVNTYIMSEEEYNVYVIGALSGRIKLSLANIFAENAGKSRVSELFYQLQGTEVFNKDRKLEEITILNNKTEERKVE